MSSTGYILSFMVAIFCCVVWRFFLAWFICPLIVAVYSSSHLFIALGVKPGTPRSQSFLTALRRVDADGGMGALVYVLN